MQTPTSIAYTRHVTRSIHQGVRPLTFKQFVRIVWEIYLIANKGK